MGNIAKVKLIKVDSKIVLNYLRKTEKGFGLRDLLELSRSNEIDFNGDYDKAIALFNHLLQEKNTNIRLIIDVEYDIPFIIGNCF